MFKEINNLAFTLQNKGAFESVVLYAKNIFQSCYSYTKVFILKCRGYCVDFNVALSPSSDFFQSYKKSITIYEGTRIGRNTRINAGFKGKISIGRNVLLDDGCCVMAQNNITIGNNSIIAAYCFITDFNHAFNLLDKNIANQGYTSQPIIIEDNVWIGTQCVILPGVKIGKGSIIGAGSVVTKSVKAYTVVAGNPAKVIKQRV